MRGLAAVLAAIGVYGLVAFTVARRANDFAVRLALGATQGGIMRLVLGSALRLAGVGVLAGVPLALWGRRAAAMMIPTVAPGTAWPIAAAAGSMIVVAPVASSVRRGAPHASRPWTCCGNEPHRGHRTDASLRSPCPASGAFVVSGFRRTAPRPATRTGAR